MKFWQGLQNKIYMDYAGAAPLDPQVGKLVAEYTKKYFGNPSAIHTSGVQAKRVLEQARKEIASMLFAHADEIIFTGSGTESDALAIEGVINAYYLLHTTSSKPHIVTTNIEHSAVLELCKQLEKEQKIEVTYVPVNPFGIVEVQHIKEAIKENTVLVSVMYANNEIGTIQPIKEVAKIVRGHKKRNDSTFPLFHTDACQAMNYLDTHNIDTLGVDLLSFNGAKIYGPRGMGVLYKKRGVTLAPLFVGGGQEFGLRSGTENVAGVCGMVFALFIANKIKEKESERLQLLQEQFFLGVSDIEKNTGYEIKINGNTKNRLPNNVNITIAGISSELLVLELDAKGIAVSSKSACKSTDEESSHVIAALRLASGDTFSKESLRFSFGRDTTEKDIARVLSVLEKILFKYQNWK